jgi:iron complex transport system permease protein
LSVVLVVLIFVAIISMLFGVGIGSTSIAPVTTMKVILSHLPGFSLWFPVSDIATDAIVWDIRFPRVILALFIGSALAVAGAALQGLLRNPLAEPYTIGVASGASVGAALVIVFLGAGTLGAITLPLAAFLGALATGVVVYRLAVVNGHLAVETLILAGVVMSSFMSAILSFMLTLAGESLQQIVYWMMGSLGLRGSDYFIYTLPLIFVGVFLLCFFGRDLNIMTFGDETVSNKAFLAKEMGGAQGTVPLTHMTHAPNSPYFFWTPFSSHPISLSSKTVASATTMVPATIKPLLYVRMPCIIIFPIPPPPIKVA